MNKIILVDDNESSRLKISSLFKGNSLYNLIGEFSDGLHALHFCYSNKTLPDLAIIDIEMPKMDGVALTDYFFRFFPTIKVVAISSYDDFNTISDIFSCGAIGYVWKIDNMPYLFRALDLAQENIQFIDPRLTHALHIKRENLVITRKAELQMNSKLKLSKVENEIIALNAAHVNYKMMSIILNKQPKTIETIVNRINRRLNIVDGHRGLFFFSFRNCLIKIARIFKSGDIT